MNSKVAEAIDKCSQTCASCKPGMQGHPTQVDCSRIRCPAQLEVIKVANACGELI